MRSYSWYNMNSSLDSPDFIHQILAFGTLEDILDLRKKLGLKKLREVFLEQPKKVYTKSGLNFISKFILGITSSFDEARLLKNAPRNTR